MKSLDQMHDHLLAKSAQDPEFRQALIANPKEAIGKELGIEFADDVELHIHESDMKSLHLSLPFDGEMTEEQLEAVAGGLCCCMG